MTVWIPTTQPPAIKLATWVKLPDDSVIFARYSPVNHVWRRGGGAVVWPVAWRWEEPDDNRRNGEDDWLICSVDRFVDYWLAGWESGTIARPACTH